jgi:hypothetical protein
VANSDFKLKESVDGPDNDAAGAASTGVSQNNAAHLTGSKLPMEYLGTWPE